MLAHPDRKFDAGGRGNILILLTVVVAYIAGFIAVGSKLSPAVWAILIALGVVHIALAGIADRTFFCRTTSLKAAVYFLLQLALCTAVQVIGGGNFWLMLMPLASTAASLLSRWATGIYYAMIMAAFITPLNWEQPENAFQNTLVFGCALIFVWIFTEVSVRDQQIRRDVERLARELEGANLRLRESAAQAEELTRSRERNRMAREIHDSLGHYLTVVNVQLEAARALVESKGWKESAPELYATLEKAQTLTRSGLADVRRSVAALRTDPIADKPFLDAVEALIADSREAGLVVALRRAGEARAASPQTELALYRALQEALTNIRKHARASRVDVTLAYGERTIRLEVVDNGVGISPPEEGVQTFGLRGIRERAELLRGKMEIAAASGGGTRLQVELPLENPAGLENASAGYNS